MKRSRTASAPLERVRLYESVRTAHLERAKELAPATIVYLRQRYDFDSSGIAGIPLERRSLIGVLSFFLTRRVLTLEINEPLLRSSLPVTWLALIALGARNALFRQRTRVVSYAIENFHQRRAPRAALRSRIRFGLETLLSRRVHARLDRLAFGTEGAEKLYSQLFAPSPRLQSRLVPALPAARRTAGKERDPMSVVFLGALTERKGFPLLLECWPDVVRSTPSARLTVLGRGPLAEEARRAQSPSVVFRENPAREDIWRHLDAAQVLVLPSQPTATWREQVGLPIVEALSSGTVVVTTDQTGIATWLSDHGHAVLPADAPPALFAAAVVDALRMGRTPGSVTSDLPARDGRLTADDWLFSEGDT